MSVVFYQLLFTNALQISYSSSLHHLKFLNAVEKTVCHGWAAHTCLFDVKAHARTLARARFSLLCASTLVISRTETPCPSTELQANGILPCNELPLDRETRTWPLFEALLPTAGLFSCFQDVHSGPGSFQVCSLAQLKFSPWASWSGYYLKGDAFFTDKSPLKHLSDASSCKDQSGGIQG